MSNLQSVIAIDVDTSKFDKFKEVYDKYAAALSKQPETWKKIEGAAAATNSTFEEGFAALVKQLEVQNKLAESADKDNRQLTHADRLWTSISRTSKSVAENISAGGTGLLKWAESLAL